MLLESIACDVSRKPQATKQRQGGKKKLVKNKLGKKKLGKNKLVKNKLGKKKKSGEAEKPGKKMDAKNVHSRAYHKAQKAAIAAGKSSADARLAGQKAAQLAVANM